ncbi:MAG: hypothetical protein J6T56_07795 [Bacteroidales bacterium]|nr:hypothetical protein [Bacteroidales bacterium]MBP5612962.1 hypothetical protein [Bacteroidales bacterium]
MKKLLFFMVAGLLWQCTCAQPFIRHYWLDDFGRNYTLNRRGINQHSPNHGFVLAASSQDVSVPNRDGYAAKRAIVIMKLRLDYSIEDSRVFKFDETSPYNFEIHDIYSYEDYYYLCGDMTTPEGNTVAIVGIVDTFLNQLFIHAYHDINSFSSIYVEGGCYYVCGKTDMGHGIILENDYSHSMSSSFTVTNKPLYKIIAKNNGGELYVVGTDGGEIVYMNIITNSNPPGFSQPVAYMFNAPSPDNVSITNFPGNRAGMIISTAIGDSVYIHFFDNPTTYSHGYAFREPFGYPISVKDINCAANKFALVGEYDDNGFGSACFFKCNLAQGGIISAPNYAQIPPQFLPNTQTPILFKLYKVFHGNTTDTLFHAGGYCDYMNNSTTFVGSPEEIWYYLEDGTCANPLPVDVNPTNPVIINIDSCLLFPNDIEDLYIEGQEKEYREHDKCEENIPY